MPWIVRVEYVLINGSGHNTFGPFRTERAAGGFAAEIQAWDEARPESERSEVRTVFADIQPVTRPALDFVRDDVDQYGEVVP